MGVSPEQLQRAITAAKAREAQGYFTKVKAGDQKAASLFARLVAFDLNPNGEPDDFGWLTKQHGESQVDGYAEDAIVLGNDPNDLENVIDLVNGAGASGASIGGAVKPRRATNTWEAPKALTAEQMAYIAGTPAPVPVPVPATKILPKGEAFAALTALNAFYAAQEGLQRPGGMIKADGTVDTEAVAQWFYQMVIEGVSLEAAKAQIRDSAEWKGKHR